MKVLMINGSPVYYAGANATLTAFLTRLFFSSPIDKRMKVGAAVVAARRERPKAWSRLNCMHR